jgi:hypothetical protein
MLGRLPAFPALCTLTLWLSPNRQAECMLTALNPMPNLTSLVFRVVLESHFVKGQYDDFREILYTAFPWDGSESMKSILLRTFPLLRHIAFHFCVSRHSDTHFRRGLRRQIERDLKLHWLKKGDVDLAEYLELVWLDEDYNPVTYKKTNGKPPWTISRSEWNKEPETEASDCGYYSTDESE